MRGGDPGKTYDLAPVHVEALRRFFDKIIPPTECWEWDGSKVGRYGSFGVRDEAGGNTYRAHRLSYSLVRGPIPEGFGTDHLCGNPSCVNPWHLELVTNRENVRRQNSARPRIDGEHLRAIRKGRSLKVRTLAAMAHVSDATIYNIERGLQQQVNPATLRKLADALRCSADDLAPRTARDEEQSA